jgi:hypothetical protein
MAWGGAAEQEAEHRKGNLLAKNWQYEAEVLLDVTVTTTLKLMFLLWLIYGARWNNTGPPD